MKHMLMLLLLAVFHFHPVEAAIFGIDDRVAISPVTEGATLARSTAIAVLSANIEETAPNLFKLETDPVSDFLCKEERFSQDRSLSYACSGFLVGHDLLVTAGHCMVNTGESHGDTDRYCPTFSWLFDFQLKEDGSVQLDDIPADRHYRCKQVIYAVHEEQPPYRDFALVQLDRPVPDRAPLALNPAAIPSKERLSMIGYPLGSPAKLAKNARILKNDVNQQSFLTSLDGFDGNSGSAVFNSKNEVVGLLVAGSPYSFVEDKVRSCSRLNRCNEMGKKCLGTDKNEPGTVVQKIQPVLEKIREFEAGRAR